ncbi:MAG: hypothetical protein IKY98_03245, partial [Alphaproteobacteria bacterium]|nr:hypothetical protein [Alphaproteobacteria bacterium]
LGILLVSSVWLIGFFRKKDLEVLLKIRTTDLKEELGNTLERLKKCRHIVEESPIGILFTHSSKVLFANDYLQKILKVSIKEFPCTTRKLFGTSKEFFKFEQKALVALTRKNKFSGRVYLEGKAGGKHAFLVTAQAIKTKYSRKEIFWFFQDAAADVKNVELETYYQMVFRVLSVLHLADENMISEEEIIKMLLKEVISVFGIKTGVYFKCDKNLLKLVLSVGDIRPFDKRVSIAHLDNKADRDRIVVQAALTQKGCVYNDVMSVPYYKKNLKTKIKKRMIASMFAFPVIIDGQLDGVICLHSQQLNGFTDNLVFRVQQLNDEICKNLANIRLRREAQVAIHQYEECLRDQIHELENNKKIMQRQAKEMHAMVADLILARDNSEAANKAKTEFLANVSHELRTPLNAILGFSETIENETFGPLANKQYKDYIKYISASGKHLLSLINDVLDLARVEEGRQTLIDEEVSLGPLLENVVSLIRRYPGGDKRKIIIDPKLNDIVLKVDARSMKQIMLNVLSNAVKFTSDKNGKIKIGCEWNDKKDLIVFITDNGIGVPEDKMPVLFEPFVQAENAMTREHDGTGLGLALVRRLIEMHGGHVWAESAEDKGTTLYLELPKKRVIKGNVQEKRKK